VATTGELLPATGNESAGSDFESKEPGGGLFQSLNVRTAMLFRKAALIVLGRLWLLLNRTGVNKRSIVAALAFSSGSGSQASAINDRAAQSP
jgi:hypothetical protein